LCCTYFDAILGSGGKQNEARVVLGSYENEMQARIVVAGSYLPSTPPNEIAILVAALLAVYLRSLNDRGSITSEMLLMSLPSVETG